MNKPSIIRQEAGKRSGQPIINNMRLTVKDVMEYKAAGMSDEEILADFPGLTKEDIMACYKYAAEMLTPKQVPEVSKQEELVEILSGMFLYYGVGQASNLQTQVGGFLGKLMSQSDFKALTNSPFYDSLSEKMADHIKKRFPDVSLLLEEWRKNIKS